ncbi:hypothetical protein CBR_g23423 [Chara braunii]|uniref:Uncharacterized protein n=1 Tax=Chara braunii TaxID=69332 RepID=A0A388L473_CHABU|nr:hypothetical protein CBR_g23423 [Chara braunii]|eukprot:GBG77097.1 hypothetical protein CBR_g23423 [Chara braunii]
MKRHVSVVGRTRTFVRGTRTLQLLLLCQVTCGGRTKMRRSWDKGKILPIRLDMSGAILACPVVVVHVLKNWQESYEACLLTTSSRWLQCQIHLEKSHLHIMPSSKSGLALEGGEGHAQVFPASVGAVEAVLQSLSNRPLDLQECQDRGAHKQKAGDIKQRGGGHAQVFLAFVRAVEAVLQPV